MPVADQIEGHHRHDDDERGERNQRLAAGPQRIGKAREPGRGLPTSSETALFCSPERASSARAVRIGNDVPQARHMVRKGRDQRHELLHHEGTTSSASPAAPARRNVTISSAATVRFMPSALQPVGQRRLHVGERHAGHERQQDLAQQPQQGAKHQERSAARK